MPGGHQKFLASAEQFSGTNRHQSDHVAGQAIFVGFQLVGKSPEQIRQKRQSFSLRRHQFAALGKVEASRIVAEMWWLLLLLWRSRISGFLQVVLKLFDAIDGRRPETQSFCHDFDED